MRNLSEPQTKWSLINSPYRRRLLTSSTTKKPSAAEPEWLALHWQPEWQQRYGRRLDESRLPKEKPARQMLAETIGRDGVHLWQALWAEATPARVRQQSAVEVLRRVWVQQFYQSEAGVAWRMAENMPPTAQMINSPYAVEARLGKKRETTWLGYKAHFTEICDDDQPHFLTAVVTTPATTNSLGFNLHPGRLRFFNQVSAFESERRLPGESFKQMELIG